MESRDTWPSATVYLNKIVIKLTVLLGGKVRNAKTYFKMRLVTNGLDGSNWLRSVVVWCLPEERSGELVLAVCVLEAGHGGQGHAHRQPLLRPEH